MSTPDPKRDREATANVIRAFLNEESFDKYNRDDNSNWLGHAFGSGSYDIDALLIEGIKLSDLCEAVKEKRDPPDVKKHLDHLWKAEAHNLPFNNRPERSDPNGFWLFDRAALGVESSKNLTMQYALRAAMESIGGIATRDQLRQAVFRQSTKWKPKTFEEHLSACSVNNPSSYINHKSCKKFLYRKDSKHFEMYSEAKHGPNKWRPLTSAPSDLIEPPGKTKSQVIRYIRDTKKAINVKCIHEYRCQMCGYEFPGERRYAEAHHIKPLWHNGLDVEGNILCLCARCHAEVDYGVVRIDLDKLTLDPDHTIVEENIRYHNESIFGQIFKRPVDSEL